MNKPFLMDFNSTYENLTTTIEDIDYRSHLVDILGFDRLKRNGKLDSIHRGVMSTDEISQIIGTI